MYMVITEDTYTECLKYGYVPKERILNCFRYHEDAVKHVLECSKAYHKTYVVVEMVCASAYKTKTEVSVVVLPKPSTF